MDKTSVTIKPDKPVTPRVGIDTPLKQVSGKKVKGITIELGLGNKSKLKLRAIAKHVGALADELDAIDNMKECPACGSYNNINFNRYRIK